MINCVISFSPLSRLRVLCVPDVGDLPGLHSPASSPVSTSDNVAAREAGSDDSDTDNANDTATDSGLDSTV